jgi:hypothetical protein
MAIIRSKANIGAEKNVRPELFQRDNGKSCGMLGELFHYRK